MTDPKLNDQADELIGLVRGLGASIVDQTAALKAQDEYGKRNRYLIRLTSWSLAFDILLSVATIVLGISTSHASHVASVASALAHQEAAAAQVQLVGNCISGNVTRLQQLDLWEKVLDVPAATAAGRAVIAADLVSVKAAYAPKDCSGE